MHVLVPAVAMTPCVPQGSRRSRCRARARARIDLLGVPDRSDGGAQRTGGRGRYGVNGALLPSRETRHPSDLLLWGPLEDEGLINSTCSLGKVVEVVVHGCSPSSQLMIKTYFSASHPLEGIWAV